MTAPLHQAPDAEDRIVRALLDAIDPALLPPLSARIHVAHTLAPIVARLIEDARREDRERLADAWEKGAYDGREYQKALLAYRGPLGMGRQPVHPPNPYRAALRPKETGR